MVSLFQKKKKIKNINPKAIIKSYEAREAPNIFLSF